MKKIISIDDLLQYLGEIDHGNTSTQEVIIKKITHDGAFPEEVLPFRDFGAQYVEKEIPQPLFIDAHNRTYKRFLNEGEYYYLPISYESKFEIYQEQNLDNLIELTIPGEIYRGGYSFYINEKDELVASVEVTTLSNLNDYIAYQASTFSYVESYPVLNYPYTSVYGASVKENITVVPNIKSDLIHRFPILSKTFEERKGYCLSYYYKKDSAEIRTIPLAEEDHQFIALRIYFKSITAVLSFLNNTIFNSFNEYTDYQSKYRYLFLTTLTSRVAKEFNNGGNNNKKEALVYHLPQPLYYDFEWESLWVIIETLAKGYITNVGINEEDLIIKTLRILYFRYTHKRKENTIDGSKVLEEKNVGSIERNTLFIKNLLNRKVENEISLYKLIKGLNGEQFKTYINFIWKIWKSSAFAIIDPAENKEVTITDKSPVLIDYRSDSTLGFLKDNSTIKWDGKQTQLDISVTLKTGEYEEKTIEREDGEQKILVEKQEKHQYQHHPFSPIVLVNSHNPKFFVKEDDEKENLLFTKIPSFMLFANQEVAYWQNIIKGAEYAVDIVTTVSGVGNILKAGRIYRLLKNGKTLLYKTAQVTKTIATAKAVAGVIEVSSGTVNTLLKLTELDDTELGKTITKYLFYLEMLSLAGEVTALLKDKLSKTAKELVENPKLTKSLDDLVRNEKISELEEFKFYEELFTVYRQYIEELKVLGIVPKLTHAAEKAFLRRLKQVFYKQYKSVLLKLNSDVVIIEKWNNIALSKPLLKLEIEELLDLRKLKKSAFNKNTAILEVDLLVQGKKVTLKYKAIAGKGQSAEGLVKSANQEDLIRQLELNDKNELNSHFQAIDKQTGDLKNRFQDSEVKMLDTFDEDLSVFHVTYGKENIQVTNMRLNTLYEPCISCKKQIIIRQEIYDIKDIDVRAVYLGKGEFVQGNNDLKKLGII
ncbi:hypothetical protein [Tenacibaculum sp.]|uniref:hypothetical protein n=1 Tax=Tenacibaculum sp. TaxID=1906242 RepID=UPI003AA84F75